MACGSEYVELQVASNFSFLRGASHPEEFITRAKELGLKGLALTDLNSLAGIVRAYKEARALDFPFYAGTKLTLSYLEKEIELLVYPTSLAGYGALCRLLTLGKRRSDKNNCTLTLEDFAQNYAGFVVVIAPPAFPAINQLEYSQAYALLKQVVPRQELYFALSKNFANADECKLESALQIATHLQIKAVATGDLYYHLPQRRLLQDVLTCIRHKCSITQAGYLLFQNAERHLKSPAEMQRLFSFMPQALRATLEIAEKCTGFSLAQLKYEYPQEVCPDHLTPSAYLRELTWQGAAQRYPQGPPEKVRQLLQQEFSLIEELKYEKYFLTCYEIVQFARKKGILCQGRGAAANSAVCFCLGITAVDPTKIDLLFARFVSKERNEPPDIDIDFEHERREEVIQYIYERFGRDRAGLTCEVVTYRNRSAVREVGKALGLALESVDKLAKSIHRWTDCEITPRDLQALGLDFSDIRIKNCIALSRELLSFPRHLSQHVGGFIVCEKSLCEMVPILNAAMPQRTMIEWDKNDIEELGMLKIDVLGLGMLSCIRKALQYINKRRLHENKSALELHSIPPEDPAVYEMICKADTIGVFQIESRAQMSMLPRLKPRCFYDLVIEVAIVRPGPIQGNMVHPYLKRRHGLEKAYFPDKRVEDILGKTLGVPLFQEQAMRLAIVLAKFSPDEAEALRRAMANWKRDKRVIATFRARIIKGMRENGYSEQFAETCMNQIKGFSEYGFPESHAASFALLVYASSWIKKYYPAEFACALLNSQPMGFYAPSQIVSDAKAHAVKILPIDVNKSTWDCTLHTEDNTEENAELNVEQRAARVTTAPALRLGMRLVKGLEQKQAELISQAVQSYGQFCSVRDLWLAGAKSRGLHRYTLENLAQADAFGSMRLNSREALWQIKELPKRPLPLDPKLKPTSNGKVSLPELSKQQSMFEDYRATGLSLKAHPLTFIRPELDKKQVCTTLQLKERVRSGQFVSIAGIAIVRQRPGTAKGVVFVTLEDETGISNLIIRPEVFERHRHAILSSSCMLACGVLERSGEVLYVNAQRVESLDQAVLALKKVPLPSRSYSY